MSRQRTTRRKTRRRQRGGILPLAALIPAAVAVGKAAALGGVSGAAGYGVERGLRAALRRKNQEGLPRRLKNDDSDEHSHEAFPEAI